MFKLSGEKLNLSSGMASAASRTCFSMALISRSRAEANVGAGCEACAGGALAAVVLFALCPNAVTANIRTADNVKICMDFMGSEPPVPAKRQGLDVGAPP